MKAAAVRVRPLVVMVAFGLLVGLGFLLSEGAIKFLLAHPRFSQAVFPALRPALAQLYVDIDRRAVQFERDCAQYDPELFYTLRPGRCRFDNHEFQTTLSINRAGVRDTEEALFQPEIIALGDSFTQGWGVEGDGTFAALLGKKTGLRVLNAGISSYGTVRERLLLDRLDTSHLKHLILQYCNNDISENQPFSEVGNRFFSSGREIYEKAVEAHGSSRQYLPGKLTSFLLFYEYPGLARLWPFGGRTTEAKAPWIPPAVEKEVDFFLNALAFAGKKSLEGVDILVFEAGVRHNINRRFIPELARRARESKYPAWTRHIRTLDVLSPLSDAEDYFIWDDHWNERGHRRVTDLLLNALTQKTSPSEGRKLHSSRE